MFWNVSWKAFDAAPTSSHQASLDLADGGAQVVYPALDAKVKNVTVAYTVEHEEEVRYATL